MLLPQEVELCDFVGLSEDEYFHFLDLTQAYNGKRAPEYDHIPNIVNGNVIAKYAVQVLISIVVGYISSQLNKPKQRKAPPSLQTEDINSQRRYAPQQGFDSLQALAALGENIPLVFTNKSQNPNGGVRVNTKLLWSQMRSLSTSQQLKAIFLLSGGELGAKPDFSGYAIGDTLLESYTNAKLALYSRLNGGALEKGDIYDEGTLLEEKLVDGGTKPESPFAVQWPTDLGTIFKDNIFSGCRTPTTNTQFGGFAPMPNSNMFRVNYELIVIGFDLAGARKDELYRKRRKVERKFPKYCAITGAEDASGASIVSGNGAGKFNYPVGSKIIYQISGDDPTDTYADDYQPWGVDDVRSSVDSIRINADTNLAVGDLYLLGSGLGVIEKIEYSDNDSTTTDATDLGIWLPKLENGGTKTTVKAYFKIIEGGPILDNAAYLDVRPGGLLMTHRPEELTVPMRAAVATVTNNRNTQVTEIGIKSTVWKQIAGFPNVNSHPGAVKYGHTGTVNDIAKDNGNISLGQINKYVTRYSFFRLYGRVSGKNAAWELIDGGKPFAVRGNSPQAQYNFIRIRHSSTTDQMEFKFVPYPGNLIKRLYVLENINVRLLAKNSLSKITESLKVNGSAIEVYYSGYEFLLTKGKASNPDWHIGKVDASAGQIDSGVVIGLHNYKNVDVLPSTTSWGKERELTSTGTIYVFLWIESGSYTFFYNGFGINTSGASGSLNDPGAPDPFNRIQDIINVDPNADKFYLDLNGKRYTPGNLEWHQNYDTHNPDETTLLRFSIVESVSVPVTTTKTIATIQSDQNPNGAGLLIEVEVYPDKIGGQYPATWRILNGGTGWRNHVPPQGNDNGNPSYIRIIFATPDGGTQGHNLTISTRFVDAFVGNTPWEGSGENDQSGNNIFPYDAIADIGMYDCERFSNDSGPEHEISVLNEQRLISPAPTYDALALAGLRINANKEWSSFSQFSAYIKQGIKVLKLVDNTDNTTKYSSNLFPEIAYHLLTNTKDGAGKLIGVDAVDRDAMKDAAKFCKDNGFYFDGVITEAQNLREFLYEHASACLLDFTVLGGQFSLQSVVPGNGSIDRRYGSFAVPDIDGLFTDGNTKNLKTAFLTPEERQLFNAVVLYREEKENGFPITKTLRTRLTEEFGGSETDPEETFDLSNWCCSQVHAEIFAKYAIKVREVVDHGITFETPTNMGVGLKPGSFIKFVSTATHLSRFNNGSIGPDGAIRSTNDVSDGDLIYYWKPGDPDVTAGTLDIDASGKAKVKALRGSVFTTRKDNTESRVYKVESISFADEGFIEITASYCPVSDSGGLKILEWNNQFI